jgi:hypothetical protein
MNPQPLLDSEFTEFTPPNEWEMGFNKQLRDAWVAEYIRSNDNCPNSLSLQPLRISNSAPHCQKLKIGVSGRSGRRPDPETSGSSPIGLSS